MSLRTPVDSWYRLIVEVIDNVQEPCETTRYMMSRVAVAARRASAT